MTAKKVRPELGTPVTVAMSRRDVAAAIGTSTAEVSRWIALAGIDADEFERRLRTLNSEGRCASASSILAIDAPVPARERVDRAMELWRGMSAGERAELINRVHFATEAP